MQAPPPLKSKKSLDWISKSFKRKQSSSSVSSASSEGTSASTTGARTAYGTKREPLLAIPGSPACGNGEWSPPSSSSFHATSGDEKDYNSPSSASPHGSTPRSGHRRNPSSSQPSPLPSPSTVSYNTVPVIPVTLKDHRHSAEDDAKAPASLLPPLAAPIQPSLSERGNISSSAEEQSLVQLSSRKALRTMLDDPVGLWKFGQFMASEMNAETLVFWLNAEQHRNDLKRLYSLTKRIHSLHIPSNAPLALNITSNERTGIERCIRAFIAVDDPFKVARDTAFQALYLDAWPRFLQWRLELLHNLMRHGGLTSPETSFTLADPSQDRDQPLLLVSDGFLDLCGYSRTDVLMRNCRFLQGPGTAPAIIDRIRSACKNGTHTTEMLLNYRKDGVPFWSLLRIIPLRNASGKLKYLLGAQINVTSVLAATPDLAHLLADQLDPVEMAPQPYYKHDLAESQRQDTDHAMRSYLNSLDKNDSTANKEKKADIERRDIANKSASSFLQKMKSSPVLSSLASFTGPGSTLPPGSSASTVTPASPHFGGNNIPSSQARLKSANRDMHLQAAAALALDNTMGSSSTSRPLSWNGGVPASAARPTTSGSLFNRPGTAYSMADSEGKAQAQLSLSEQTKAFNDSSSFYVILDSSASTILFVSANLPACINIGGDFGTLVGPKINKQIKQQISVGERIDIDSVSFNVGQMYDPSGLWKQGVKICLTPLKDQINEVGAVVVLISRAIQK